MADSRSIEAKRQEGMETLVIGGIAVLVIAFAFQYYSPYIWYYSMRYFYLGMSFVPDLILKFLFLWKPDVTEMVPAMSSDLAYHSKDFLAYYTETSKGNAKRIAISNYGLWLMSPYLIVTMLFMLIKEFRRPLGAIKRPSEKGGGSALYRYAKSQADIWPYIKPVVNIMGDMVKEVSLEKGWYALSALPYGWMKDKNLFNEVKNKKRRKLLTVRERQEFTLDRERAYLALKENLGPLWKGLDDLDFNYRCLLAVIIPHIFGKVKMSRLINRKICNYHESEKSKADLAIESALREEIEKEVNHIIDMHKSAFELPYFDESKFDDPYDPLLSSFEELDSEKDMFDKGEKLIQDTLLTHAYVKTVMLGLIQRSWTYGVLASAELLWVKKVDRDLWYVVTQQGRTSAFIEVSGAWSHYLAEDSYGFRTIIPQVGEGINAFDFDLWSTHANYIPLQTWDDTSKWDKLVPDSVGKGTAIPRPPSGGDTNRVM